MNGKINAKSLDLSNSGKVLLAFSMAQSVDKNLFSEDQFLEIYKQLIKNIESKLKSWALRNSGKLQMIQ